MGSIILNIFRFKWSQKLNNYSKYFINISYVIAIYGTVSFLEIIYKNTLINL